MTSLMNNGPSNLHLLRSTRSHLSGVSLRVDCHGCVEEAFLVELYGCEGESWPPLRSASIDTVALEAGEAEHLYWNPLEGSKDQDFFIGLRLPGDDKRKPMPLQLLEATPIYSPPQGYASLPQALVFSPVSQCNLNCTHCISRPTRGSLRRASESTWTAVSQITRGAKFASLATHYSGDILFDERRYPGTLSRIIALDAIFRIDTNANCLDDDLIEMLLKSRLYEINFSIDSMDPDIYRRIRRGSIPLPEVLAKITSFMSRKRSRAREIRTVISFLLMRSNAATIKPALEFACENGIDHVNVVPMLAFTEDMLDEIFVWDEVAYAALYRELTAEAARVNVSLVMQAPVKKWREQDIHAPCQVPWGVVSITANGDVMACCMPGTVMGNLNEHSIDEIWNGSEFAAFRMRVNSPDPPKPCRNCGMSRVRNNPKAYAPVLYGASAGSSHQTMKLTAGNRESGSARESCKSK
ncbi:MAG: SPASM domain-containing protein [Chthoniobacterales bacterium]